MGMGRGKAKHIEQVYNNEIFDCMRPLSCEICFQLPNVNCICYSSHSFPMAIFLMRCSFFASPADQGIALPPVAQLGCGPPAINMSQRRSDMVGVPPRTGRDGGPVERLVLRDADSGFVVGRMSFGPWTNRGSADVVVAATRRVRAMEIFIFRV